MPDQEMLKEIRHILDLTSRVDERMKAIVDNHEKITERFDKFMNQHTVLSERVTKLEITTWSGDKIENRMNTVEDSQRKLINRIIGVENSSPLALKIVNQSLEALNKLSDRVVKVEAEQTEQGKTVNNWRSWLSWGSDWCFKVAWIVIAAYILAKIGLGGVSIPAPF